MRAIKEEIEQKLTAIELDDAWLLMEEYEKEAPMDMDLLSFKIIYSTFPPVKQVGLLEISSKLA